MKTIIAGLLVLVVFACKSRQFNSEIGDSSSTASAPPTLSDVFFESGFNCKNSKDNQKIDYIVATAEDKKKSRRVVFFKDDNLNKLNRDFPNAVCQMNGNQINCQLSQDDMLTIGLDRLAFTGTSSAKAPATLATNTWFAGNKSFECHFPTRKIEQKTFEGYAGSNCVEGIVKKGKRPTATDSVGFQLESSQCFGPKGPVNCDCEHKTFDVETMSSHLMHVEIPDNIAQTDVAKFLIDKGPSGLTSFKNSVKDIEPLLAGHVGKKVRICPVPLVGGIFVVKGRQDSIGMAGTLPPKSPDSCTIQLATRKVSTKRAQTAISIGDLTQGDIGKNGLENRGMFFTRLGFTVELGQEIFPK